jgi:hypothetical protein
MAYTINTDVKMMFDTGSSTEKVSSGVLFARSDFVFTAAALSLLAGFLVPFSPRVLDIFWGLNLCFSMVLLLITFSAKSTSELSGFPQLMLFGVLLRIILAVTSAKLVIHNGLGGIIIETLGKPLSQTSPVWIIIIMPITAVVVMTLIYGAAKRIAKASVNFTLDILPLKQASVKTDLNMGLITDKEAENLDEKIKQETRFYLNMAGVGKLLFCEGIITGLVVIITIAGLTSMSAIGRMGPETHTSFGLFASLAAGAAVLILLPELFIVLGTAHLLGKSSLTLQTDNKKTTAQQAETIEIISNETGKSEKVELLNPDFAKAPAQQTEIQQNNENITSFEPVPKISEISPRPPEPEVSPPAQKPAGIEDYYKDISSRIESLSKDQMPVLFAAERIGDLPVTTAVNTAILLAQKGHKCLLIDADPERNAIAKVFDIPLDKIQNRGVPTCIENLSIWTSRKLPDAGAASLKKLIDVATKKYDRVMIYAPNMNSAKIREKLPLVAANAVIFSADNAVDNALCKLMDSGDCQTLAVMPPPSQTAV